MKKKVTLKIITIAFSNATRVMICQEVYFSQASDALQGQQMRTPHASPRTPQGEQRRARQGHAKSLSYACHSIGHIHLTYVFVDERVLGVQIKT